MDTEDVIELGSSDEEPDLHPPKKMKSNAMVHIPTNLHGVTIKPVKTNMVNTTKLFSGKNITVTKIQSTAGSVRTNKILPIKASNNSLPKIPSVVPKAGKRKAFRKPNPVQSKGTVFNPLSQVKSIGNSVITRIKNPIPIMKPPTLPKLPPSVTVKKTGGPVIVPTNVVRLQKAIPVVSPKIRGKGRTNTKVVPTVELDIEGTAAPSDGPQWYMRPEEQTEKSEKEKINNKEPETPSYIEITIEDSPIKQVPTKRARELSTENVITIQDSPNKPELVTEVAQENEDSDDEPKTKKKKTPQSKKKLDYGNLETIEEACTLEIEIDPIAIDESSFPKKDDEIVTITPDSVRIEKSESEIALHQQGDVAVVVKPIAQPKEKAVPFDKNNEISQKDFHPTYLSFINLCLKVENSDDMKKIVEKKIKPYYTQAPKEYTQSEHFIDMVSSKVSAIKAAPEKMYLYIKDIVDELNLQRKLAKYTPIPEVKPKTFEVEKDSDIEPSKQRQIRKLEKTLKKLNRAIQKLEMQEVDFEDEEDSVYLLTEKYKERMVRVHAKFCQLTNSKLPSEPRLVIDHRQGKAPGPAKRLEAYINKKNTLVFPDFHDVLRCVREANEADKLGWSEAIIMEEARDLFVRCGRQLQRRRQEKEWRLATSRLSINEDPAEQSEELKNLLDKNRRLAKTNETEIINKFSDKQLQLKLEAEEINDNEAEDSPVESEEEDNDQSLLENKQRRKDRIRRLLQEQSQKQSAKKTKNIAENEDSKQTDNDVVAVECKANLDEKPVIEDDNIQLLSDDSNEVGSDVDELHLLQKLRSDDEVHYSVSTADSTDSDSYVEISDTLNSNSDEDSKEKENNVISIENSSYSEESDTQDNVDKTTKKNTVATSELVEESLEMECSSADLKNKHFADDPFENALLTSSDAESSDTVSVSNNRSNTLSTKPHANIDSMEMPMEVFDEPKSDNVGGEKNLIVAATDNSSISSIQNADIPTKTTNDPNLVAAQNTLNNVSSIDFLSCPDESNSSSVEKVNKEETVVHRELSAERNEIQCSAADNAKDGDLNPEDDTKTPDKLDIFEKSFHTKILHGDAASAPEKSTNIEKNESSVSSHASKYSIKLTNSSKSIDEGISSVKEGNLQSSSVKSSSEEIISKPLPKTKDDSSVSSFESREGMDGINPSLVEPKVANESVKELEISRDDKDCSEEGVTCGSNQAIEVEGEIVITNIMSSRTNNEIDKITHTNLKSQCNLENSFDMESEINGDSNYDGETPNPAKSDRNLLKNNDDTEMKGIGLDEDESGICVLLENPISEQSVDSVEKMLDDMLESEITAVDAPLTLSPT